MSFLSLTVIPNLILMICLGMGHSLPTRQETTEDSVIITSRAADYNYRDNMDSQFQAELANLSISSHLKDLYLDFGFPNEVIGLSSNHEDNKIDTIQSYKNEAKGKYVNLYQIIFIQ